MIQGPAMVTMAGLFCIKNTASWWFRHYILEERKVDAVTFSLMCKYVDVEVHTLRDRYDIVLESEQALHY